ncbi:MAG: DUF1643 domain-containing protein, partial [Prochloraceae cyanobacterium]|nr:DUF1643 domain-containing protein [Prochloraceae cyanobacterium]
GNAGSLNARNQTVLEQLANFSNLYCLGITKKGHPRHPLYIRSNEPLKKLSRAEQTISTTSTLTSSLLFASSLPLDDRTF